MDFVASLFAGLGLFFIGIRLIGANLKQMAGRKLRRLITRAVSGAGSTAAFGLLAGAIMQSVNAVTFVLVALVSAGAIDKRKAMPVISWANLGTSLLVLVAALSMHDFILVLIGATGLAFYFNLDQSSRYRYLVSALLGVGLLFLGVDLIKTAAHALRDSEMLREAMQMSARFWPISFAIGLAVAMVIQSSTTVTVVAMAMAGAGLLPFAAGAMIVIGAGLGSGLSGLTLAGRLTGSARQLVLYQIALKAVGVGALMLVFLADWISGGQLVIPLLDRLGLSRSAELAAVYLALQAASTLCIALLDAPISRLIEAQAPPSIEEVLGKPQYLSEAAMGDADTAILVANREQARLLASLPRYLDALREDGAADDLGVQGRCEVDRTVTRECNMFLAELAERYTSRDVLDQTLRLRDRNELIVALQTSLVELAESAGGADYDNVRALLHSLVESLHLMLETLADVAATPDEEDLVMLRMLTHDRSELMDSIRRRMQAEAMPHDAQQRAFAATTVFERCVWLLRRYVLLLDPAAEEGRSTRPFEEPGRAGQTLARAM
ncbi:Na/Pi symporter [Sphingomonas sp.]|uniref:Na/Pi symporter n=1 Tax=Sphingomonas sp. TaxID=28214 RepID=UPI002FDAB1E6